MTRFQRLQQIVSTVLLISGALVFILGMNYHYGFTIIGLLAIIAGSISWERSL